MEIESNIFVLNKITIINTKKISLIFKISAYLLYIDLSFLIKYLFSSYFKI